MIIFFNPGDLQGVFGQEPVQEHLMIPTGGAGSGAGYRGERNSSRAEEEGSFFFFTCVVDIDFVLRRETSFWLSLLLVYLFTCLDKDAFISFLSFTFYFSFILLVCTGLKITELGIRYM
jgi:hypothetical protein